MSEAPLLSYNDICVSSSLRSRFKALEHNSPSDHLCPVFGKEGLWDCRRLAYTITNSDIFLWQANLWNKITVKAQSQNKGIYFSFN